MKYKYQFLPFILMLIMASSLLGQTNTSSPYSMYGIGDLRQSGFSQNRAMGSTGIALSNNSSLNNINPASYNSLDSLSFLFESGMEGRYLDFENGSQSKSQGHVNFSYLAFGFRCTKWWGTSAGITPYSTVGNKITTTNTLEGTSGSLNLDQSGSGGFNQFYWSNSFRLFKGFSVGLNLSYLFGTIYQTQTSTSNYFSGSLIQQANTDIHNLMLNYGFQYSFNLSPNIKGTIGGIYGNSYNFLLNQQDINTDNSGYILTDLPATKSFSIPSFWGIGIALNLNQRLIIASDFKRTNWSNSNSTLTTSFAKGSTFTDSKNFSIGLEYSGTPSFYSNLLQRSKIRLGGYYNTPYILVDGNKLRDFGITAGLGLPISQKLRINLSYQYGQRDAVNSSAGVIAEKYQGMTFGVTFSDIWFFKPKYD